MLPCQLLEWDYLESEKTNQNLSHPICCHREHKWDFSENPFQIAEPYSKWFSLCSVTKVSSGLLCSTYQKLISGYFNYNIFRYSSPCMCIYVCAIKCKGNACFPLNTEYLSSESVFWNYLTPLTDEEFLSVTFGTSLNVVRQLSSVQKYTKDI
jgi:hypothetical protein